jgi:hypothetical protein
MSEEIGPLEIGEIKSARFEFAPEAGEGVTLSLPTVTCVVLSGVDASPAAVLVGSPTVVGTTVVQKIQPGVVGCVYKLNAFVSDSSGLRHHISTKFRVVPG